VCGVCVCMCVRASMCVYVRACLCVCVRECVRASELTEENYPVIRIFNCSESAQEGTDRQTDRHSPDEQGGQLCGQQLQDHLRNYTQLA